MLLEGFRVSVLLVHRILSACALSMRKRMRMRTSADRARAKAHASARISGGVVPAEDKHEIEGEMQAEVATVKAALLNTQLQQVGLSGDSAKTQELEEKLSKYTTQVVELKEQLASAMEEKKILNIRLADTRRELEATRAEPSSSQAPRKLVVS